MLNAQLLMKSPVHLGGDVFSRMCRAAGAVVGEWIGSDASFNDSFEPPLPDGASVDGARGKRERHQRDKRFRQLLAENRSHRRPPGRWLLICPRARVAPVMFVDLQLLPIAGNTTTAAASANAGGGQVGFLQVQAGGAVYAYSAGGGSGGQWVATGVQLGSGPNGALTQWVRVTLRLDRTAATWDLYVNGAMVEAGLGLDPTSQGQLVLFGDSNAPVYVDDVNIGATNPLFIDIDEDGLPDAWVLAQTGGTSLPANARGWSSTAGGATLLELYLQTVATLTASNAVYAQPVVLVHPTIRSYGDLATLLNSLNTAFPINDANQQGYLATLAGALAKAQQLALAGLPAPSWQFASDIATAAQEAPNGATIVVFPSSSPYVVTEIDTPDKQITFDYLPGAVVSDPDQTTQAQTIIAQQRTSILAGLAAGAGGVTAAAAADTATLWPAANQ